MNNEVNNNPMPEWSLMMFWEDITAIVAKLIDLIKGLFA